METYKIRDHAYYEANADYVKARQGQYYADNAEMCKVKSKAHRKKVGDQHRPGYFADWRTQHRAEYNAISKACTARNIDQRRAEWNAWNKRHPQYRAFMTAKRRAAKRERTPPWLTSDHWTQIREFYQNCPVGHEVDHILPLLGKHVSGLHVPWNLQYLTKRENRSKGNRTL